MSEEPEGTGSEFPVAATSEPEDLRTAAPEPATPGVRRRGGALALLVALLALAVAGYALWREMTRERIGASAASAVRASLGDRLDQLAATQAKLNRDLATQRARMNDADSVNNSVHEELLSLTDRSRHLEDAIGNLAEQRLSGRDAMASNEAEFLLQLGAERLALFHDASTALAAYRLADSALASAEDPVFASVRQTIDAEIQLLMQAKPLQTQATLDALERVRAMLRDLPLKAHAVAAPVAADQSRLMQLLHQFVRIGHEPAVATDQRDAVLARDFATIDLRAAEAALLARDPQAWNAALGRVRAELSSAFDPGSAKVGTALAEVDRLARTPLSPALPELGSALKELRNLRATHALSRGAPISPPPAGTDEHKPPATGTPSAGDHGSGSGR